MKWKGIDRASAGSRNGPERHGEEASLLIRKTPDYNAIKQTIVPEATQDSTSQTQKDSRERPEPMTSSASTAEPPQDGTSDALSTSAPPTKEAKGKSRELSPKQAIVPLEARNQPPRSPSVGKVGADFNHEDDQVDIDPQPQRDDDGAPETQSLNSSVEPKMDIVYILEKSESNRQIVWEFLRIAYHDQFSFKSATVLSWMFFLMFGIFVAVVVAGISSAKIATDRAALSSSSACGIWRFDLDKAGEQAAYRDDLHNYWQEARAGQYARSCYNTSIPPSLSTTCNSFYQQNINYTKTLGRECPFTLVEMCDDNAFSATEFDTGLVDASAIGINADITYKFRRRTTCSPLNTTDEYVRSIPSDGESDSGNHDVTGFEYYYGATEGAKYTFKTIGDSFDWLIPAYSVKWA